MFECGCPVLIVTKTMVMLELVLACNHIDWP